MTASRDALLLALVASGKYEPGAARSLVKFAQEVSSAACEEWGHLRGERGPDRVLRCPRCGDPEPEKGR